MSQKLQSICLKANDNVKSIFLECLMGIKGWASSNYGIFFSAKEFISAIHAGLLQDDVINKMSGKEKLSVKAMMWLANQQAKPQKTIDDGIYTISSKLDSNMCLTIKDESKNNCANLQLLSKNGTSAQKFKIQYCADGYYTIKAMCSEKFIEVSGAGKKNGTNIWQNSENGTDAQRWFIVPDGEGYCHLVPKCNNLCMDVCGARAKNGANIICYNLYACDSRRFKLEKCEDKSSEAKKDADKPAANKPGETKKDADKPAANKPGETKKDAEKSAANKPGETKKDADKPSSKTLDDGVYVISSKLDSNMCLTIKGGSKNNCANLQLFGRNGTDAQKFKIQYHPNGYYTIEAMCSGKMLDMLGDSKNILQCTKNKRNTQKWFVVPDGEGYYCFVSKSDNLCMDVSGAKAINGTNIHCWSIHAGDNQRFNLEKCEDKSSSSKLIESKKSA